MSLRLLCLIFIRICGWLVLPGRSPASKNAELLVLRHEAAVAAPRQAAAPSGLRHDAPPLYCLSVMEAGSRCLHIPGVTANPDGPWTVMPGWAGVSPLPLTWGLKAVSAASQKWRTGNTVATTFSPRGGVGVVRTCKNLKYVERDFKTIKIDDLDIYPIRHYLPGRGEAHLLICMLVHARRLPHLAPVQSIRAADLHRRRHPSARRPVIPVRRSPRAAVKDAVKKHPAACRFTDTATCWSTSRHWTGKSSILPGSKSRRSPSRSRSQAHAFGLLGAPVPVRLT